jgi:putative thioredoxin
LGTLIAKRTRRLYTICLFDAADSLKPMYLDVTDATFQTDVVERSAEVPVVIDLWAPWCGPCRTLGPIIEKVIDETDGQVALVKVNVDENPNISRAFQVQSIPLVIAVKDGQAVDGFLGAQPEAAVRDFVLGLLPTEEQSAIDALVAVGDEASLRQALELDPGHEAAVIALAELLVEKGESEEALGLLARIPENAETRRVAALARLGDEAPADDDFDEKLNALLDRVKDDDAARQEYVDLLELMGADDPRTAAYRKALTARLY